MRQARKHSIKKILTILLTALVAVPATEQTGTENASSATASPVTDGSVSAAETTRFFSMTSADGTSASTDSKYNTIISAGTYTVNGLLEGQIVVNAGEKDKVVLDLNGTTITYGSDSTKKIVSADSVEISAKSGTENVINDTRSAKKTDDSSLGEGEVYSKCDLKFKGTGTLVFNAGYSGIFFDTNIVHEVLLVLSNTSVEQALYCKLHSAISIRSRMPTRTLFPIVLVFRVVKVLVIQLFHVGNTKVVGYFYHGVIE